ncbi:tumor necrosis factor receptor superfamily member 14-like isoform X1 [Sphaeramia orbicularis]|uniref:tumor necrosis factor receptor superfamily member 14-like isoform X1 n=1 Tax=Sphaeramia orbicularis TaxID=375764 RepID=UPI0011807176|nr:tumor necrosis factor receptor superfamily member 14-like isoform X1 [Sphaeramia orbicularis]XP_029995746.1 tumor necrosis factor receptor superfamily member 14-like isoform X1 [Sphaeramia orbicularis]
MGPVHQSEKNKHKLDLLFLFFSGYVAVLSLPALCCRPKEYSTAEGQCCPMCHEGTVVRKDCTSQSGTRCIPCDDGTFMNKPNGLASCFHCSACDSVRGLLVQQTCTYTTDTVCGVLDGYFCKSFTEDSGCDSAQEHKPCAAGQRIKEPGTSRTDTVCEDCPQGFFSKHGVNCTPWTVCTETQVKTKEGSSAEDVVCAASSRIHTFLIIPCVLLGLTTVVFIVLGCRLKTNKQ